MDKDGQLELFTHGADFVAKQKKPHPYTRLTIWDLERIASDRYSTNASKKSARKELQRREDESRRN